MRVSVSGMKRMMGVAAAGLLLAGRVGGAQDAGVPVAAQHAFTEGAGYEQRGQLPAAMDSFQAANKAAGGHCAACLKALARVQLDLDLFKDSAVTAALWAKDAPDAANRSEAEHSQALALFEQYFAQTEGRGAIDKDPKRAAASLKQADAVLQKALAENGSDESLRMLHGRVLAAEKRDEEASMEFEACAAAAGVSQEECTRAKHFAKDVSVARNEPAPGFSITTMDGKEVSLDSLAGKVVLLDFWATWCKYCERDSDYVQSIADSFRKEPFVLLEVSVDESETKWSNYVKDRRLAGLQSRDDKGTVKSAFHVTGFPTYVVMDGDGVVRMRAVGGEGDLKAMVRKLVSEVKEPMVETRTPLAKSRTE